jgi:hypothetical protein
VGKKHKLFLVFTLLLFSFSTISTFMAPKVSAAEDMPAKVDTFFKLQTFRRCINNVGIAETLVKGDSNTVFGSVNGVEWIPSGTTISVGYVVDPDNGEWACGIASHADDWFKLIGYKNFKDFRDQKYKSKGSDSDFLELKDSKDVVTKEVKDAISSKMPDITGYMRYYNFFKAFQKCASGPKNKNDIKGTTITIKNYVKLDGTVVKDASFERTEGDQIPVGHYAEGDDRPKDGKLACETIAERLDQYSDNYKKWADENKEEVTAITEGGSASSDPNNDDSCEAQTGVLAWVGCPVVNLISGTLNWIDAQLNRLMIIDRPLYASNEQMYEAWSRFRNIALSILVIAMLVMVISTALSLNFLDAYTVKKAFPRMVAAIVFITLSWWICVFMIDLFNVIGQGVLGIMTAPFNLANPELSELFYVNAGGAVAQGGALVIIAASAFLVPGALGILMSWLGAALLVMAIAFITLVARQMFVIVLVLFSPLAILSWIFPNNDKLWKFWWGTFTKLLLMYPMVMALIGAGRIFASVIATTSAGGAEGGLINPLLKLTAYVLPYAFIPFTFKAAGGVFGNLVGMANDRSKGAFDRLRKSRQKNMSMIGENAKSGKFVRGGTETNRRGRLNRGVEGLANIKEAGLDPRYMRNRMRNALSDGTDQHLEEAVKNSSFGVWSGDDAKLWAARYDTREDIGNELARVDGDRFGAGHEEARARAVEQIMKTKRELSPEVLSRARIRAQAKTGTGYIDENGAFDASLMMRDINEAYGDDRNGAGKALAEMRSSLTNSGQIAGMAGFGTWAGEMENMYNHRGASEEERAQIAQNAHNTVMDDAAFSITPDQALYGKPSSAAAVGAAHRRRIQTLAQSVRSGDAVIPTGENDANGAPIMRAATNEDVSAAVAHAAGIYDAIGRASPNNADAMAEELMSANINGPDAPAAEHETIRDYIQWQMGSNDAFVDRRRDLGQGFDAAAAAEVQRRAAGTNPTAGTQTGTPGGSAGGGVPGL